jgi:cytochrome c oxidase subunit 3/cytochrome o ubiquinol oxidase subunit 3
VAAAPAPSSHAHEHAHPPTSLGLPHIKVGFWTFIGSDCLFFGSLIAAYMAYRNSSRVGPFPHAEWTSPDGTLVHGILNIPITSISAFVLLMSSVAMVIALDGVVRNRRLQARLFLFGTAILGLLFLGFQSFEFTEFYHNGLTLQQNLFGSTFFVLTGFHGTHVAFGVLWLLTMLVQDLRHPIPPSQAIKVEICGLYWHFVDIVWIVIFTFVYLVPTFERFASHG